MEILTLKQCRALEGLSRKEASELLGISQPTLWKYENGEALPRIDTAIRISQFYGRTFEQIKEFIF